MVKKKTVSAFVVGASAHATDPRTYRDYFARLLRRLQIPPIVFHGLRHTFATRCIESECDYKTVSTVLGHSDVSTTLNLYVHPNLEQKKRCIEKMSKFVEQRGKCAIEIATDTEEYLFEKRYCPQNVCKLQSSYICGAITNQIKNNEAYSGTKIGNYF